MNIEEQFNLVAKEYDANRRKFIPCFDDFYINTTKLITSNIDAPKKILDLGAGTGLLTYYWFKEFKNSEYFLVDIANEMLDISRNRFAGLKNVHHFVMNYAEQLPDKNFDAIISALSIHHLSNEQKSELFKRIYLALPSGGIFVNYDQFCAGTPLMNKWFDTYWENQLYNSELTNNDIEQWKERRKLDKECSVEEEIEMLKRSSFTNVKCIYSCHKFSVIVAVK